ncbi:Protein transport protein GOT1 [Vanrija pseudolonga]|uniref:Protein transport protein GOT1 n=1 Tax=Vanrija pseudolonga TaxID=143232 RepID=A0AAF0XZY6_9TREE|nr:Protein transport protein GOT1 [Vanrija pseudolonga]
MWLSDRQKIGVGLVAAGVFLQFLAILLFFDRPLLALGNVSSCAPARPLTPQILFLTGLPLIIGPTRTFYFFSRREKWRGTVCFFGGIILVFAKWPKIGILVEFVGFIGLFGSFFPVVLQALRQIPVIGSFLSLPYIRQAADRLAGVRQSAV